MAVTAPKHLSRSSKRLYRRLVTDYELAEEVHALEVLRLGLEALDRAAQARVALAAHGMTYVDRFGAPKARPEVAIERDARIAADRRAVERAELARRRGTPQRACAVRGRRQATSAEASGAGRCC